MGTRGGKVKKPTFRRHKHQVEQLCEGKQRVFLVRELEPAWEDREREETDRKKDRLSSVSVEVGKRGRERDSPGDTLDCIALVGREGCAQPTNRTTPPQTRNQGELVCHHETKQSVLLQLVEIIMSYIKWLREHKIHDISRT